VSISHSNPPTFILTRSVDNLDYNLTKYLRTYFRKEVNEKQRANEIECGIEVFGEGYKHSRCVVM
jgi:E3 ubiquitin-protein ligase BAH